MTMNIERLYQILDETTTQLRKGDPVERHTENGIEVIEIFNMPHEGELKSHVVKVDMVFLSIGVDEELAQRRKEELIEILRSYPEPERLAAGPSYIEVGGVIGDQGRAFQLFALGQVLGLWSIITPATLGASGKDAHDLARRGFIMISGYHDGSS